MRISDWSSDVCSSDLRMEDAFRQSMLGPGTGLHVFWSNSLVGTITTLALIMLFWPLVPLAWRGVRKLLAGRGGGNGGHVEEAADTRSEERRVGKECVGKGWCRGWRNH